MADLSPAPQLYFKLDFTDSFDYYADTTWSHLLLYHSRSRQRNRHNAGYSESVPPTGMTEVRTTGGGQTNSGTRAQGIPAPASLNEQTMKQSGTAYFNYPTPEDPIH